MSPKQDYDDADRGMMILHGLALKSGLVISLLVDTGCTLSSMPEVTARRLGLTFRRMQKPTYSLIANGSAQRNDFEAVFKFRLSTSYVCQMTVMLMPGSAQRHDMLLGMDWMTRANPKVNFRPLSLKVSDANGKFHELLGYRPPGAPEYCYDHGYGCPDQQPRRAQSRPHGGPHVGLGGVQRDELEQTLRDFIEKAQRRQGGMGQSGGGCGHNCGSHGCGHWVRQPISVFQHEALPNEAHNVPSMDDRDSLETKSKHDGAVFSSRNGLNLVANDPTKFIAALAAKVPRTGPTVQSKSDGAKSKRSMGQLKLVGDDRFPQPKSGKKDRDLRA